VNKVPGNIISAIFLAKNLVIKGTVHTFLVVSFYLSKLENLGQDVRKEEKANFIGAMLPKFFTGPHLFFFPSEFVNFYR
jgi:hypothetical protein